MARLTTWAAGIAIVTVISVACISADHYVYSARRFNPAGACLDPYKSIDIVNGSEVSSACAPTCFTYGTSTDVYTSRVCPPLPDLAALVDPDAGECRAANALYDTTCGVEAGAPDGGDDGDDDDDAAVLDAGQPDG